MVQYNVSVMRTINKYKHKIDKNGITNNKKRKSNIYNNVNNVHNQNMTKKRRLR